MCYLPNWHYHQLEGISSICDNLAILECLNDADDAATSTAAASAAAALAAIASAADA